MNGKNPAILRAMYIILVPVVAMIILLNSGYLQRLVPAARLNGAAYSVVRYNYYYFDFYNSFLEENALMLDELGYDPSLADSEQSYDGQISWKEFFQRQAETNMKETGLMVSKLYIAQVKDKCGLDKRPNYNLPKSKDARQPQCPPDKEAGHGRKFCVGDI